MREEKVFSSKAAEKNHSVAVRKPELLCPAGSPAAFDAAIEGGADAIYIGGTAFNARINAKNFTAEDIRAAVKRAHSFGVKVYIAANTLIYDRERDDYIRAAREAYRCGADAMIVADIGAASLIKKYSPDVVILNEMRDVGERDGYTDPQTKILSELTNMPHHFFAKAIDVYKEPSPYGNGILSKIPFEKVEIVHIPDSDPEKRVGTRWYEHRCFIKANLECGLTVLGVHAGLNPEEKLLAVKTLIEHIEPEKCILLGDFNMRPENEELIPIRERMQDAAELFKEPLLSCPSDEPKYKIDYIFATRDIEILSADIPADIVSDHRPHIAEIRLK